MVLELQLTDGGPERAQPRRESLDVVPLPGLAELRAVGLESGDQAPAVGLAQPRSCLGPELGQEPVAGGLPVRQQLPYERVGEHHPQQVALRRGQGRDRRVEGGVRVVPAADRPVRADREGGRTGQGVEQVLDVRRRAVLGGGVCGPAGSEAGHREQVAVLGRAEVQRGRQGIEDLSRGMDVTRLLEPGVPGHADPRQGCDLLATKARRASPSHVGQADRRRGRAGCGGRAGRPRALPAAASVTP